ncbi:aminodeoxychorismate synthase component I [Streptomyces sp. RLB3-17]|uniref:aminodeoxychorismate synthase component I n=1 Tax=Streptomyces sp. RLB3-17 TaxID=2594455 RepID=UPI00116263F0|nr:aminodeoxychorismate synthase component I [Streptomyces sp. RLB3-17]QDO44256.1 aminodeoxychorismate synthase component I [Streptomyces sp. RLB3-17]
MRTLLVDNYDSFTYNLHHYLAEVSGQEPVVIRNDDPSWHRGMLDSFDSVVLSPGPGDPAVAADFGICREIVEHARLPLLGVCLGHQGLALAHGATVSRAPEPRHGRLSPVLHDGTGLFAGLPSPFEVVRYHSLAVTDLPEELRAVARTPDGVLMGIEHRDRPMWGLQFHPESILTRHGHDLLANFTHLSRTWRASRAAERVEISGRAPAPPAADAAHDAGAGPAADAVTGAGAGAGAAQDAEPEQDRRRPRSLRVLAEQLPSPCDAEVAYDRLFRGGEYAFWLDSSRSDMDTGRFSVMGDASGPLARVAQADVNAGTVTVRSAEGTRVVQGGLLEWLDRDLRSIRVEVPPLDCGFALGWVGYLGYELKAECGGDAAHRSKEPDAVMVFADRALVFDHLAGTVQLLALAPDGDETAARAWLRFAQNELAALAARPAAEDVPAPAGPAELRLRHDRDTYLRLIADCRREIAAGETYEVCLTNMAEVNLDLDPWQGYRFLRRNSPAPYGALLSFGPLSVLSTSPERFLHISADGTADSRPIKGTRPRGATPAQDADLAEDLRTQEKDRAENLMIVDLVRNDLGRCAEIGSVEADLFQVETYATVHQLTSRIRARLSAGLSSVDWVRAAFPPGSMTGAPKIRTMQLIDKLEAGPRGIYSGAIGYFSLTGAADLSVVIRTAVVTPGRIRYGVGGAVIALSDPMAEFKETAVKARPLLDLTGADFH